VLIFIESKPFLRDRETYLDDDEFRALQAALERNPDLGVVIPGAKGLRKLRWASRDRGKRGGLRIIYFIVTADQRCLLLYVYAKSRQDDLDSEEMRLLMSLMPAEIESGGG
jgi:hypothetical protein